MRQIQLSLAGRLSRALSLVAAGFMAATIMVAPLPAIASAKNAAIVIDANTGKTLHAESADAQRHPASLTKMMTLYMVFERMQKGSLSKNTRMRFQRAPPANRRPSWGSRPARQSP